MSVIIDDSCITCDACLQNCPVNAILDDTQNPTGNARYYVQPEKCIECVGVYDDPQCAAICPSIGCITWDMPFDAQHLTHFTQSDDYVLHDKKLKDKAYRKDIDESLRGKNVAVEQAPDEDAS